LSENNQTDGRLQTSRSNIRIEKNDFEDYCKPRLVVQLAAAYLYGSMFPHAYLSHRHGPGWDWLVDCTASLSR